MYPCVVLLDEVDFEHSLMAVGAAGKEAVRPIYGTIGWQRQAKGSLLEQPPPRRRPLGLTYLWGLFPQVELECHQHVLSRINVVQSQIEEAANRSNVIRSQIPNADGATRL